MSETPDDNGWHPIATIEDAYERDELEQHFLCWNPCDGPHLFWLHGPTHPEDFRKYGRLGGLFTHWKNVGPGPKEPKP